MYFRSINKSGGSVTDFTGVRLNTHGLKLSFFEWEMYFIVVIYKRKMEILLEWNFSKYFIGIRKEGGKEFFQLLIRWKIV